MKRIAQLAVLAVLACGAQAASAQDVNDGARLTVAQAAAPAERYEAARSAQPLSSGRDMLIELGFSSGDGFPSRGGPLDD